MSMSKKLKDAEPYNLFFSSHSDIVETHEHKNFIIFSDLLCPSLGKLKYSLQITNYVDIEWVLEHYDKVGYGNLPLTILYGQESQEIDEYLKNNPRPNVKVRRILSSDPYGKHHSKMGIYVYDDNSLRVVVSTANIDDLSWTNYCQSIWISPLCMPLVNGSNGEGPTNFKGSLLKYLNNYPRDLLRNCISYIEEADFSTVKVFLVTSVPGNHYIGRGDVGCHLERVGNLLSQYCKLPNRFINKDWPIILQASSIGNIGKCSEDWLCPALLRSIDSHVYNCKPKTSKATVNILYPTKNQVLNSLSKDSDPERHINFYLTDFCWAKKMLCSWKAEKLHLTNIIPRSKSYCRFSSCGTKLAWFLLTSANVSKSAWGGRISRNSTIYVRSFELGVLFLPKIFGQTYFNIKDEDQHLFPLMFDTPLTAYEHNDEPWHVPLD